MGFGVKLDVKVEAPKVEAPKLDVGAAVAGATSAVPGAVVGVAAAVTGAATAAVESVTSAATSAAATAAASLNSVAGAIADVAVSFTGAIEDIVIEPHLTLDANASYGDTQFEKGPVRIRLDMSAEEAGACPDELHLFSDSGSFDERRAVSAFTDQRGSTVIVRFEQAPMNETFSLEVIPAAGSPTLLFSGVPYGDLRRTRQRYL